MKRRADAIAILGGGLRKDRLGRSTIDRLEKGIELFRSGVAKNIIVSGGKRHSSKAEASLMHNYLKKKGLPKERILLEQESKDTIENALFTKEILKSRRWQTAIVITSDFHIPRTKYIFRKVFGKDYKISFVPAPSSFPAAKLKKLVQKESEKLKSAIELLSGIPEGNDRLIRKVILHGKRT